MTIAGTLLLAHKRFASQLTTESDAKTLNRVLATVVAECVDPEFTAQFSQEKVDYVALLEKKELQLAVAGVLEQIAGLEMGRNVLERGSSVDPESQEQSAGSSSSGPAVSLCAKIAEVLEDDPGSTDVKKQEVHCALAKALTRWSMATRKSLNALDQSRVGRALVKLLGGVLGSLTQGGKLAGSSLRWFTVLYAAQALIPIVSYFPKNVVVEGKELIPAIVTGINLVYEQEDVHVANRTDMLEALLRILTQCGNTKEGREQLIAGKIVYPKKSLEGCYSAGGGDDSKNHVQGGEGGRSTLPAVQGGHPSWEPSC